MKINWGTGIVIGMLLFMAFIMYMVVTMMTDDQYDHDLVTEAYYERDLQYQTEIDAEKKGFAFSPIQTQKTEEGLSIVFPKELEHKNIRGTVFLYRPSNKRLDFNIPIVISNSQLLIPDERLLGGRWNITIDWEYQGESYLYKEAISY